VGIANQLTLVRLGLSPVFILVFVLGGLAGHVAAFVVAGLFEITDILDGYLARAKEEQTDFGKLMDPLADSVARFSVFLCFLGGGYAHIWVVALIFYRDAMVAYSRVAAAKAGVVMAARLSGKIKAIAQGIVIMVILGLIVWTELTDATAMADTREKACYLMLLVGAVTLWSGVDYLVSSLPMLRRLLKKSKDGE
jgi:CDP-diacylglycerol---glycerol-3-phosphate 3-phosphatidyltransferase